MKLLARLLDQLDQLLAVEGESPLDRPQLRFVQDEQVEYGEMLVVVRSGLKTQVEIEEYLQAIWEKGPDWVHANLIRGPGHPDLVTIRHGRLVGNPRPAVNASIETGRPVRIVDTG